MQISYANLSNEVAESFVDAPSAGAWSSSREREILQQNTLKVLSGGQTQSVLRHLGRRRGDRIDSGRGRCPCGTGQRRTRHLTTPTWMRGRARRGSERPSTTGRMPWEPGRELRGYRHQGRRRLHRPPLPDEVRTGCRGDADCSAIGGTADARLWVWQQARNWGLRSGRPAL